MKLRERSETKSCQVLPALKMVQSEILTDERELEQLKMALSRMGCAGLLDVPWGVREESMIWDLIGRVVFTWDNTLRGHLEKWTLTVWRDVYGFWRGGVKAPKQVNEFLEGEFRNLADPKDGYSVRDVNDLEARMVIGFLNLIFHPEKPKKVVSLWTSTFIGSFRDMIVVDWTHLLANLVKQFVKTAQNTKSKAETPLFCYLAHLYVKHKLFKPEEQQTYEELLDI